ncbi:MAG TPA: peptidoglycan DD-metalloendopeptidase family protein [Dongiaceae bacterium]|nr:peptidoglycan DD-metalloendopeptidase family protein [Dongiaceae bacterium]
MIPISTLSGLKRPLPASAWLQFALTCALLMGLLHVSKLAIADDKQPDPVATQKELKQVQAQLKQLQEKIRATQSRRSTAEKELRAAEKAIGASKARLREVAEQQKAAEEEVARLEVEQQRLEAEKQRQQAAIKASVIAAHRSGRQEYVKMLLNQEDPQQLSRHLKFYEYFRAARLQKIDAFNQTLTELDRNREQIATRMAELETLRGELDLHQQKLVEAQTQRKALLAKLDASLQDSASQTKRLKANESNLEKVLKAVQESMADLPRHMGSGPFGKLQGKLLWPTQGRLLRSFGSYREEGALRWNGVLIGAAEGSPVQAVAHGRVVFADWMRGFGNLIIVDHGAGYMSLYGQNESLLKTPGDWVSAGDLIARSGTSGGQTQPGLYFEIRHRGKPVNPALWCKG